jgi:hypothetical protein
MFFKNLLFFSLLHFSASIVHGSEDHEHDAIIKQILRAHRQYQQMIAQNPILENRKLTPEDADILKNLRAGSYQPDLKNATELLLNPENHWLINQYNENRYYTALRNTIVNYRMIRIPKSRQQPDPSIQISKLYALMLLTAGANPDLEYLKFFRGTDRAFCPELITECENKIKILKQELKQDEENEKLAVAALLTQTTRNCVLAIVFSQLLDHNTQS